jgi:hypothetical protein
MKDTTMLSISFARKATALLFILILLTNSSCVEKPNDQNNKTHELTKENSSPVKKCWWGRSGMYAFLFFEEEGKFKDGYMFLFSAVQYPGDLGQYASDPPSLPPLEPAGVFYRMKLINKSNNEFLAEVTMLLGDETRTMYRMVKFPVNRNERTVKAEFSEKADDGTNVKYAIDFEAFQSK